MGTSVPSAEEIACSVLAFGGRWGLAVSARLFWLFGGWAGPLELLIGFHHAEHVELVTFKPQSRARGTPSSVMSNGRTSVAGNKAYTGFLPSPRVTLVAFRAIQNALQEALKVGTGVAVDLEDGEGRPGQTQTDSHFLRLRLQVLHPVLDQGVVLNRRDMISRPRMPFLRTCDRVRMGIGVETAAKSIHERPREDSRESGDPAPI